ncbi:MAG: rhodanese-like domain-containing protein [Desulfomonile tiedjei]|nr:rhodanese-like domain-containing protein [Desulfomonile tiedjei]
MFEKLKKVLTLAEGIDPDQLREYIATHAEGTYTLLDVRQPKEYEKEHIPGSTLVPLPRLTDSLDRLDPTKPVIVY